MKIARTSLREEGHIRAGPTRSVLASAILLAALTVGAVLVTRPSTAAKADGPPTVISARVSQEPVLDGQVEALWDVATLVTIALARGRHGADFAYDVELRAIHTGDKVFFLVRWPEAAPSDSAPGERNKLILHFGVPAPWPGADDLMCLTACHTAYVDDRNRGRYLTAETIPPGLTDPLVLGGGWRDGYWTFEWGRPLVTGNPFDVQYSNLSEAYRFFVKIVEGHPNLPDPASEDLLLRFQDGP